MKQDRFLLIILVIIGLLIVLAVAMFFIRQGVQEYGPEDSPEGVLRNYVLALEKNDFSRAYGYLQDAAGKPDFTKFRQNFLSSRSDLTVRIGEINRTGDEAVVELIVVYGGNEPFSSSWSEDSSALLTLQNGEWKITYMPSPYWNWNWYSE